MKRTIAILFAALICAGSIMPVTANADEYYHYHQRHLGWVHRHFIWVNGHRVLWVPGHPVYR
jgi:hypothetical protein